jgi:hypothetical protein
MNGAAVAVHDGWFERFCREAVVNLAFTCCTFPY